MLQEIRPFLHEYITCQGAESIINAILVGGILTASVVVYYLTKAALMIFERVILRSPTTWDDDLLNDRFMRATSQLAPALAVRWLIPGLFGASEEQVRWLSAITSLYLVWAVTHMFTIFVTNLYYAFLKRPALQRYAIKGVFQMLKLIFIAIGVIVGLSILIGTTPSTIFTALGASAAVLMLVFQDTILGLVASVQLTANKMLDRGDWIEADGAGINGTVLDVSLTTVKIQNWDNSVSTIQPYSLIKGSFRNYKPMQQSGGRRVDRAIYIDINSVRFLAPDELQELASKALITPDENTETINLSLFRRYVDSYLGQSGKVNHAMLHMVRQLAPTNAGLPVQLYFFLDTTEWKKYENEAADIMDHIYATVPAFGLRIYQAPAGFDFTRLK